MALHRRELSKLFLLHSGSRNEHRCRPGCGARSQREQKEEWAFLQLMNLFFGQISSFEILWVGFFFLLYVHVSWLGGNASLNRNARIFSPPFLFFNTGQTVARAKSQTSSWLGLAGRAGFIRPRDCSGTAGRENRIEHCCEGGYWQGEGWRGERESIIERMWIRSVDGELES